MTKEELLQKGYCCGQGCKECPYWPKHQYQSTTVADIVTKESKFNKLYNFLLKEQK